METIIPEKTAMDGFEVDHDFPGVGRRILLLNARKVLYETSADATILLAFTDITARRAIELERKSCLRRPKSCCAPTACLFRKCEHRGGQQPAHHRQHPDAESQGRDLRRIPPSSGGRPPAGDVGRRGPIPPACPGRVDQIEVGAYLTTFAPAWPLNDRRGSADCAQGDRDHGMIGFRQGRHIGLIVAELVINAIKYAFPTRKAGALCMSPTERGPGLEVIVSDNGIGEAGRYREDGGGLGTIIVKASCSNSTAHLQVTSSGDGMSVSITRREFTSRLPKGRLRAGNRPVPSGVTPNWRFEGGDEGAGAVVAAVPTPSRSPPPRR